MRDSTEIFFPVLYVAISFLDNGGFNFNLEMDPPWLTRQMVSYEHDTNVMIS